MQARFYDPAIGRFLSTDPKEFGVLDVRYFNRYAYAGNNPANLYDPNGEEIFKNGRVHLTFHVGASLTGAESVSSYPKGGTIGGGGLVEVSFQVSHLFSMAEFSGPPRIEAVGGNYGGQWGVVGDTFTLGLALDSDLELGVTLGQIGYLEGMGTVVEGDAVLLGIEGLIKGTWAGSGFKLGVGPGLGGAVSRTKTNAGELWRRGDNPSNPDETSLLDPTGRGLIHACDVYAPADDGAWAGGC